MPVYALMVAKNGPHLEPSKSEGLTINNRNGLVICRKCSMKAFSGSLNELARGRPSRPTSS